MTRPAIIINELDAERIDRLLEQPAFANSPVADALNEELDRAQMLAPEAMPHDVVTMNSRVKFRDLTSGEERVRTLVFPSQVTDSASQLSVLAPVGAALLGLKVGSTIHWELPGGASTHLEVLELLYQPEAAGEALDEDEDEVGQQDGQDGESGLPRPERRELCAAVVHECDCV